MLSKNTVNYMEFYMLRKIDPELTRLVNVILNPDRGYMDIMESPDDPNTFYIVEYHGSENDEIAEFDTKYIDFAYALIYRVCGY